MACAIANDKTTPSLPRALSRMRSDATMHEFGELGGIVFRILSVDPPASSMLVITTASHGSESIPNEIRSSGNTPWLPDGDSLPQTPNTERTTVESHEDKFVFGNKLTDHVPTPIGAASGPLYSNVAA